MSGSPWFRKKAWLGFGSFLLLSLFHVVFHIPHLQAEEYLRGVITSRDSTWIGGDGAFSVELRLGERLWLFGDTWVRKDDGTISLASNSVAIQQGPCDGGILPIWRLGPGTFFTPQDGIGWFWPSGGALVDGSLILVLHRLVRIGPGPWEFEARGSELLLIPNPRAPPPLWPLNPKKIPWADGELLPCSPVVTGDHLYLFFTAPSSPGKRSLMLARSPSISVLEKGPEAEWEFWGGQGGWRRVPKEAFALFSGIGVEFTVDKDPQDGRWLCVYTPGGISSEVLLRTAAAPWGPWSDANLIYSCPEASNPNLYCYGAKFHRNCSHGGIFLTYSVNSREGTFPGEPICRPRWVIIPYSLTRN